MKNKVIFLVLLGSLLGGLSVSSQTFSLSRSSMIGSKQIKIAEENTSNVRLGYCSETAVMQVGVGEKSEVAAAIRFPEALMQVYKGCKIEKFQIALYNDAEDGSLFILPDLNGGQPLLEQPVGAMQSGWVEYDLETPFEITGDELYIGYQCTGTDLIALSDRASSDALFLREPSGIWNDYYKSQGWNALCLNVVISGMDGREMRLLQVNPVYAQKGKDFVVSGVVENLSAAEVSDYEIVCKVDGSEAARKTYSASLGANGTSEFQLSVTALTVSGEHAMEVCLSKVNGASDGYAGNNVLLTDFLCKDLLFDRKVVVEEGTGIWCPYCVRGIVGLREMKEKYPDSFIAIAVHNQDKLAVSGYQPIIDKFMPSGLPGCVMNRKLSMDPSTQILEEAFLEENHPVDAMTKVSARFTSESERAIQVDTETTFGISKEDAKYRIAVVLLENGVKGYKQANGYAGGELGEMGGFESLPNPVEMELDDVARGIYRMYTGILNSVPKTIVSGETYDFAYEITENMLDEAGVQDKDNLEIVALLIDSASGEIVNADKTPVLAFGSGIDATSESLWSVYPEKGVVKVSGDYEKITVYDLTGRSVRNSGLTPGIYIVRVEGFGNSESFKVCVE